MTVATTASQVERSWTGSETVFSTGFRALAATDCLVQSRTAAGVVTTLVRGTHYTSAIDGSGLLTVTPVSLPTPPTTLIITRQTPLAQTMSLATGRAYDPKALEAALDSGVLADQELSRRVGVAETKFGAVDAAVTAAQAAQDAAEDAQDEAEAARDTILNGPYVTVPGGTGNQSLDNLTMTWPGDASLIQKGIKLTITDPSPGSHVHSKMLEVKNSTGGSFNVYRNGQFFITNNNPAQQVGMAITVGQTGALTYGINAGTAMPHNLVNFYDETGWAGTYDNATVIGGSGTNRTSFQALLGALVQIAATGRYEFEGYGGELHASYYLGGSSVGYVWHASTSGQSPTTSPCVYRISRTDTAGTLMEFGNLSGSTFTKYAEIAHTGNWIGPSATFSANITVNGVTVGKGAGSGSTNVAIGTSALGAATTGTATVAIGHNAGRSITTAVSGTIVGREAGQALTSGSHNTAVGEGALYAASTAAQNTAVGRNTLINVTNGALNTAIGHGAGAFPTTHSNTTSLGANSTVTGSNQVQLGDSATTTYAYGAVQDRSDARDKADIRDTVLGLDFLLALRPVDFRWHLRDRNRKPPPPRPEPPRRPDTVETPEVASEEQVAANRAARRQRQKDHADRFEKELELWRENYAMCERVGLPLPPRPVWRERLLSAEERDSALAEAGDDETRRRIRECFERDNRTAIEERQQEEAEALADATRAEVRRKRQERRDLRAAWQAARAHYFAVTLPAWEAEMAAWLAENQLGAITEKDPATKGRRFHHGLIAQEVKQVTEVIGVDFGGFQDHAIAGGDDVLSLGYTEFIGPIIKAIQELAADNRALAARIDRLEGR